MFNTVEMQKAATEELQKPQVLTSLREYIRAVFYCDTTTHANIWVKTQNFEKLTTTEKELFAESNIEKYIRHGIEHYTKYTCIVNAVNGIFATLQHTTNYEQLPAQIAQHCFKDYKCKLRDTTLHAVLFTQVKSTAQQLYTLHSLSHETDTLISLFFLYALGIQEHKEHETISNTTKVIATICYTNAPMGTEITTVQSNKHNTHTTTKIQTTTPELKTQTQTIVPVNEVQTYAHYDTIYTRTDTYTDTLVQIHPIQTSKLTHLFTR